MAYVIRLFGIGMYSFGVLTVAWLGVSADASKAGHNGLSTCSGFPAGVENDFPDAQLEEETSLHLDALQPFPSEKGWSRKKEE